LIYSKSDGVVAWPACLEFAPHVEAVEVRSTHCGIPYNFDTLRIISERVRRIGQTSAKHADSVVNPSISLAAEPVHGH